MKSTVNNFVEGCGCFLFGIFILGALLYGLRDVVKGFNRGDSSGRVYWATKKHKQHMK